MWLLISAERKSSTADLKRGVSVSAARGWSLPTLPHRTHAPSQRFHTGREVRVLVQRSFRSLQKARQPELWSTVNPGDTWWSAAHAVSRIHFYSCAAISAPAWLVAAVQLLRKWLCRFIHMKVFPPKLCRGFGLNGALRESIRAKDITTVFLFLCPPPFSFIFISLLPASSGHKTNTSRGNVRFVLGSVSGYVSVSAFFGTVWLPFQSLTQQQFGHSEADLNVTFPLICEHNHPVTFRLYGGVHGENLNFD